MREIKISEGGRSGKSSMVMAILLGMIGVRYLLKGVDSERILDYIASMT